MKLKRFAINIDLAILILILILINLPYLQKAVVPAHDTLGVLEMFHFYYSDFFFSGELPQWLPYGTYGVPSFMNQLFLMKPVNYFMGGVGLLFGIKDVLLLHKISLWVSQLVFLLGVYLLSRSLFKYRSTGFIVSLAAICSTILLTQIDWNFSIYYLLPLIIYFIVLFFTKRRAEWMWLAGITFVVSLIGDTAYFAVIKFYIVLIICFIFFLKNRQSWKYFFSLSYKNILSFIVFAVISTFYLYFILHALDFVQIYSSGRDPVTNQATLKAFLLYGGNIKHFKFPEFISGMRIHLDSTQYIGLLPLVFFLLALFKVRKNVAFTSILFATVFLIWLSFGGVFSAIVFYLPGMSYFRHIGLVYSIIKIMLLICAGFGLDYFYDKIKENDYFSKLRESKLFKLPRSRVIILIVIVFFVYDMIVSYIFHNFYSSMTLKLDVISGITFGLRLLVYGIGTALIYRNIKNGLTGEPIVKKIKIVMVLCLAFDVLSFQGIAYILTPKLSPDLIASVDSFQVKPIPFQEQRNNNPKTLREKNIVKLLNRKYPYAHSTYMYSYNFMQYDPCIPKFRADIVSVGMDQFIRARGGKPKNMPDDSFFPKNDRPFLRSIGCSSPKIKLISNAIFVNSAKEAVETVKKTKNIDKIVVLQGLTPKTKKTEEFLANPKGKVKVTQFSSNNIEIDVFTPEDAWLVYADSFHPGWTASINKKPVPIVKANIAFKAVKIKKGFSQVRFHFNYGFTTIISAFVFPIISILFIIMVFASLLILLSKKNQNEW